MAVQQHRAWMAPTINTTNQSIIDLSYIRYQQANIKLELELLVREIHTRYLQRESKEPR